MVGLFKNMYFPYYITVGKSAGGRKSLCTKQSGRDSFLNKISSDNSNTKADLTLLS